MEPVVCGFLRAAEGERKRGVEGGDLRFPPNNSGEEAMVAVFLLQTTGKFRASLLSTQAT